MKIRADDPAAMKDFILSIQNTSNKLKASSGDDNEKQNSKRVSMLCFIIKGKKLFFLHTFSTDYLVTLVDGVHA